MAQYRPARHAQQSHDDMVREMVTRYKDMRYTWLQADLEGYLAPAPIEDMLSSGIQPDIYCLDFYSGRVICEVETADTIYDEHTEAQWRLFDRHAKLTDARLHIVVPEGSYEAAEDRLRELGITGAIIFTLTAKTDVRPPLYA